MMASCPRTVIEMLDSIRNHLDPTSQHEISQLKEAKKIDRESCGELFDGHVFYWD